MKETKEQELRSKFFAPTAEYRPAPLWVWNDDMQPERIRLQLKEMADHGFGGAFVHPRPGLVTPYLSEEWFALWGIALEEAQRLGLKLYIYDENSYPSGFAGGHVPAELPDCLANCVVFKEYGPEELGELVRLSSPMLNRPGQPIRAFAMRRGSSDGEWNMQRDLTLLPIEEWERHGESFWLFELGTPETNSWLGGFAYTDLLRPEVTAHFLRTTHEQYRSRFGDRFGTAIPALFTDEPEISPGNLFQDGDRFLPFSYWFASEFTKRNGYDLLDYLPFLFRDAASETSAMDAGRVRYDYFATIHELWTANSVRPISEWCERNGLAYTGHYLEHNWPHPFNRTSPAVMSMYEYMHWPAIDMLMTYLLRETNLSGDFFPETSQLMIGIREAHSAANQFDRPRVLCEAFGAGGWDSSFEDFKRIGDWLFANGINFLNPHLTYSTIAGARKRDHPQSFDWRQPWWDELGSLNGYFARLSLMLSAGRTFNRILVLNPTTSSYLFSPRDLNDNVKYRQGLDQTRELAQRLCDAGWDYDWGDEYILARHGSLAGAKLQVGNRMYDTVIVPPAMLNLKGETAELLSGFLAGGGQVIAWNDSLARKDGRPWQAAGLTSAKGWRKADNYGQVGSELLRVVRPRTEWASGRQESGRITRLLRELDDGSTVCFLVNSSQQRFEDTLLVAGRRAEIWDPLTGAVAALPRTGEQTRLAVPVALHGSGSLLVRVYQEDAAAPTGGVEQRQPRSRSATGKALATGDTAVSPEQANIFPLFYCDLELGAKTYAGLYTVGACRLVYEHHGFPTNPWDNAVQFKRRLLDRESSFDERTGFAVQYRFKWRDDGLPAELGLMIERPELYAVRVNGEPVAIRSGTCRLDHHMGQTSIRDAVRRGENIIRLEAKPFSIFMEIEAVYLTGDFIVTKEEGEWTIGRSERPLAVGSWREQGYPFYGSAVVYSKKVKIPDGARDVGLTLPDWRGTIASVQVNGVNAGLIGLECNGSLDITAVTRFGEYNDIAVRVCGSFKNLLGPHFDPAKPRNIAWPGNWKSSPVFGPPAAELFDLIDYGLFADFIVETAE